MRMIFFPSKLDPTQLDLNLKLFGLMSLEKSVPIPQCLSRVDSTRIQSLVDRRKFLRGPSLENFSLSPMSMASLGNGQVGVRFPSFFISKGLPVDMICLWVLEPTLNFFDWKNCSTQVYGQFSTVRGEGERLESREGY